MNVTYEEYGNFEEKAPNNDVIPPSSASPPMSNYNSKPQRPSLGHLLRLVQDYLRDPQNFNNVLLILLLIAVWRVVCNVKNLTKVMQRRRRSRSRR
tara:strand:- start:18618 stop:18905 length:288 start_codon:yes stop_codon:yes gene_type:complete